MSRSTRAILLAAAVPAMGLAVAACVDGPFPRTNPFDPDAAFTLRIETDTNVVSGVGGEVVAVLVVEPARSGYAPRWTSNRPELLRSEGFGVFRIHTAPAAPTSVTIRADFDARMATTTVMVTP